MADSVQRMLICVQKIHQIVSVVSVKGNVYE